MTNNPSAPATAVADGISTDQTQLSYSFDVAGSHFAVVNTDPVGNDTHAPAAWLATDLGAAGKNGARHFFVFGHKPAFSCLYPVADGTPSAGGNGLDEVANHRGRDAFWAVIERFHASYFCGHEHIDNVSQPLEASAGSAYQVIVGSGGSPFEAGTVRPLDRTYSYAVVKVHRSGRVEAHAYGFSEGYGPTHRLKTWGLP